MKIAPAIATEDVSRIVRLLSDVIQRGHEPLAERRRYFMRGIGDIVGTQRWIWARSKLDARGTPAFFAIVDSGWNEAELAKTMALTLHPDFASAVNTRFGHLMGREHFTALQDESVSDVDFDPANSPLVTFREMGVVDWVWTFYPLGGGALSVAVFHRVKSQPRFTLREKTILHTVMSQVDWLHREGTDVVGTDRITELTPRQRLVLLQLLSGDSVKEIASKMNISQHTVNDHLKELHRIYGVSSRSELLARFIAGRPDMQISGANRG